MTESKRLDPDASRPVVEVVGAAILSGGRCLATQRSATMSAPQQWEFPGGKVEPGETPTEALRREIREELALEIAVGARLGETSIDLETKQIHLTVYRATITTGRLELREHQARRWLAAHQIEGLNWARADRPLLEPLRQVLLSYRGTFGNGRIETANDGGEQ